MRFHNFIFMFVPLSLFGGATNFDRWISRYVYQAIVVCVSDGQMNQGIIMFLQSLPTQDWGDHEIELLLSEAFVLNSIWHNAQSHFGK